MRTSAALRTSAYFCFVLESLACGVHEHPHPTPPNEGADDFANDFVPPNAGNLNEPAHTEASVDAGQDRASTAVIQDAGAAESDASTQADAGHVAQSQASAAGSGGSGAADGKAPSAPSKAESAGTEGTSATSEEPVEAPPAMPALVLGGVPLRKEDVLAFIHFGHSNMSGQATNPPELRPYFFTETHPRAWMYRVGAAPQPALEPTARKDHDQTAGPGIALIKQAAELAPKKYFMSLGFSHGGASCVHFTPGWPYYDELTKSVLAIKDRVTFAAIVVMVGNIESGGDGSTAVTIPDCFVKLADALREVVGIPDLPLLFSGYEVEGTGLYARDQAGPQKVIAELAKVPDLVSNSALVSAEGIPMQDDHHFNLEGHMLWTKRLLDIMQVRGWFPWAPAPAMPANP